MFCSTCLLVFLFFLRKNDADVFFLILFLPCPKPRTRPSRAPRAHGLHAPTAGATATSQRSSRRRTSWRDPRRRRTRHLSCLRRSPEHQADHRPTSVRPTCSWPPPLCPPHVSTWPLPTQTERTSAYQGGPVFVPSGLRLPSAAASGAPALRLPPASRFSIR
jgi:hypothetical protein